MSEEKTPPGEWATASVRIARIVPGTTEQAWRAWTDSDELARWWGPEHFTCPACELHPEPGGAIDLVMRGPDGSEHAMKGTYEIVEKGKRLVFDSGAVGPDGQAFLESRADVRFSPHGELATRVTLESEGRSLCPEGDPMIGGMPEGWAQTMDCFARFMIDRDESVKTGASESNGFFFSRNLPWSREKVFRAFSDIDQMRQWWGSPGSRLFQSEMELRPGGIFHYGLDIGGGKSVWGIWAFREIVVPEKIVYTISFSDEEGRVAKNPFGQVWPAVNLAAFEFEDAGDGTTIRVRWVPLKATEEECRSFAESRENMKIGWGGTLDRLEAFLKEN